MIFCVVMSLIARRPTKSPIALNSIAYSLSGFAPLSSKHMWNKHSLDTLDNYDYNYERLAIDKTTK